jgi:hypothetical protein
MKNKHKAIALTALSAVLFTFGLLADSSSAAETNYLADVENLVGVAGKGSVSLSWNPVEHANLYTVYYGKVSVSAAGGTYESQVNTDSNSFIVRDLNSNTPYFFAVAAEDTTGVYAGSYNYSNEIALTPLAVGVEEFIPENVAVVEEVTPAITPAETSMPAAPAAQPTVTQPAAKTTTEEKLPQSGPAETLAIAFGAGVLGAFLLGRRKQLVASK